MLRWLSEAILDVREFFDGMLPAVIATRSEVFDASDQTACLIVHGVGAWTLKLGDHTAADAIRPELDFDADLVATWSEEGFTALLAGESESERISPIVMGDASLLSKLGHLLQPPARGGLGARLMGR